MDDMQGAAIAPHSLTILCTYQCTAACKQCCFESSPEVRGRLSGEDIIARITEARCEFPSLKLVAFSGGEATLLKQALFDAIAHATSLGLLTRIVSNASWGKTVNSANRMADSLSRSGLSELNISTGKDHQEWVPSESVINAAQAAVDRGIFTLITVEADDQESTCLSSIAYDERVRRMLKTKSLALQSNSWMPFRRDAEKRVQERNFAEMRKGCEQIFGNVVVTPHDNLSACCGLTLEHIPEMRLGHCDGTNMGSLYRSQADDFLKFWIHVEGPYAIIERVMGKESADILEDVVHICQACAIMHKNPQIREAIEREYLSIVPEVMTRFHIKRALESR
jgi:putative lipoic acid-binding regulatory protein